MTALIDIQLNGESRRIASGATVTDLLNNLQIEMNKVAVEINAEIVPRSQYSALRLSPADHVEIVQAIGGG